MYLHLGQSVVVPFGMSSVYSIWTIPPSLISPANF